MSDEGVLSGLRNLSLEDLPRYKAALNQSQRIGWQHYFPFLFLFSRKGHSEFLISEEGGSVCIYWLSQEKSGPRLHLFLLPMPMDAAVLQSCLDRCRAFNHSKSATVRLVDQADIGVAASLTGANAVLRYSEYIYAPKFYRSLSGGQTRNLRHNLTRIDTRGDIELRPYEAADVAECLTLLDEWWEMQKDKHEHFDYQRYTKSCLKLASQFDRTDLFGKVILVDGRIRSFGFAGEMREGLANLFVGYSDHTIKGLNYYMVYQLMLDMEAYEITNASRADTPGVKFAKEVLCPVSMHDIYRIHQDTA